MDAPCTCGNFRYTGLTINGDAHFCLCKGYKTGLELSQEGLLDKLTEHESYGISLSQRKKRAKMKFIQYRKMHKEASRQLQRDF
jgi:hypothetical protein